MHPPLLPQVLENMYTMFTSSESTLKFVNNLVANLDLFSGTGGSKYPNADLHMYVLLAKKRNRQGSYTLGKSARGGAKHHDPYDIVAPVLVVALVILTITNEPIEGGIYQHPLHLKSNPKSRQAKQ